MTSHRRFEFNPWTHGRSVGFISGSIWIHDETANAANEKELLFVQDFGLRDPKPWSESFHPEITPADIYDVIHATGPFWVRRLIPNFRWYAQYQQVPKEVVREAITILLNLGYTLPASSIPKRRRRKKSESARQEESA